MEQIEVKSEPIHARWGRYENKIKNTIQFYLFLKSLNLRQTLPDVNLGYLIFYSFSVPHL